MTKPGDSQTKKTIHELVKEFPNKSYRQLEKYRSDTDELERIKGEIQKRKQEELEPIHREIRWREKYNKEHRLRQEAETETILIKGIGMNSPEMKAAQAKIKELQSNLDRIKKENNDLYNRLAKLTESPLQKARESGL